MVISQACKRSDRAAVGHEKPAIISAQQKWGLGKAARSIYSYLFPTLVQGMKWLNINFARKGVRI
jgi:hypothetical protein